MPQKLSNPLALAVLVLLFERPMHPYEMASTLRARRKEESIKLRYGSLYTVIELLQREGFIAPGETARAGRRPERTVYRLTDAGEAEMRAWLGALLAAPVKEYPQFEAALSLLPVLPPGEAQSLLAARLERLGALIDESRSGLAASRKSGLARLFSIESEYRLALLEAERAYVAALLRDIAEGTLGGLKLWKGWHEARSTAAASRGGGRGSGPRPHGNGT